MGSLHIAGWGLAVGAVGQAALYYPLFPHAPLWLIMLPLFLPWLTVYTISFCRQAPFGPRPFRYCLMFAMCWYATATLLAEALNLVIRPAPRGHFPITLAWVLIFVGVLSFIVFVRTVILLRRYETTQAIEAR